MQGEGELDYAEVGAEMAAGFRESLDEEPANFFRERDHLVVIQALKVSGRMNGLQQSSHVIPSPGESPGIQGKSLRSKAPLGLGIETGNRDSRLPAPSIPARQKATSMG